MKQREKGECLKFCTYSRNTNKFNKNRELKIPVFILFFLQNILITANRFKRVLDFLHPFFDYYPSLYFILFLYPNFSFITDSSKAEHLTLQHYQYFNRVNSKRTLQKLNNFILQDLCFFLF